MTAKIDTPARARLHFTMCPDVGACRFVGGAGDRSRCARFDKLIDQVEVDHAQVLAQVIRSEAAVWGEDTAAGQRLLEAAALIDPREASGAVRASVPFTPPTPPPPVDGRMVPPAVTKPRTETE